MDFSEPDLCRSHGGSVRNIPSKRAEWISSSRHRRLCASTDGQDQGLSCALRQPALVVFPECLSRLSRSVFMKLCSCVLVLFLVSGCAVWRPFDFHRASVSRQLPLAEHYAWHYRYPDVPFETAVIEEKKKRGIVIKRIEFPLHFPEDIAIKDLAALKEQVAELEKTDAKKTADLKLAYTNRIDYYLPARLKSGQKHPVILISSILGGTMVVDRFARYYARRGFIAALVHRKRVIWDETKGTEQMEAHLRISVIRLRQVIDWLEQQEEVDANRIGAFGISYGAILHSILAAVEPRIQYHILAMPAGQLADVILECPDKAMTKLVKSMHDLYGWTDAEIHQKLRINLVSDPIYLARYVPKDKVQIYIALFDRVVGANRSFNLWKAMDKPELKILPFGHYGGVIILPYLQWASTHAFKKHL